MEVKAKMPQSKGSHSKLSLHDLRIRLEAEQRNRGILIACAAGIFTAANVVLAIILIFVDNLKVELKNILMTIPIVFKYVVNSLSDGPLIYPEVSFPYGNYELTGHLSVALPVLFAAIFSSIIIYFAARTLISGFVRHVSARNYSVLKSDGDDICEWVEREHEREKASVSDMLRYMQFVSASLSCLILSGMVFVVAFILKSKTMLDTLEAFPLTLKFPVMIVRSAFLAWFPIVFSFAVFVLLAWHISAIAINDRNRELNRNILKLAAGMGLLATTWTPLVIFSPRSSLMAEDLFSNMVWLFVVASLLVMLTFFITLAYFFNDHARKLLGNKNRSISIQSIIRGLANAGILIVIFSLANPWMNIPHMSWPFAMVFTIIAVVAIAMIMSSYLFFAHFFIDRLKNSKLIDHIEKFFSTKQ